MVDHRILGPNESVVLSSDGCPVIQDRGISQPVPCVHPVVNRLPMMSSSRRALNILFVSITRSSPLLSSYGLEILMHSNEESDHHQLLDAPGMNPTPFLTFKYIDQYQVYLDVPCFIGSKLMETSSTCATVSVSLMTRLLQVG